MEITPLRDQVVIREDSKEEVTAGGIIISTTKQMPNTGIIVAVGTGHVLNDGVKVPLEVNAGDHVMFDRGAGAYFEVGDEKLRVMKEKDIIGIIKQ